MNRYIKKIKQSLQLEKNIIQQNKKAIDKRNWWILQVILVASFFLFVGNFIASFSYTHLQMETHALQGAYLILMAITAMVFFYVKKQKTADITKLIYVVYVIALLYCMITSAFISYNYVSVFILAVLFQIPILYIDNCIRINGFVLFCAVSYLLVVYSFKSHAVLVDEIINVCSFAVMAIVIGFFTRKATLDNVRLKAEMEQFAYTDYTTKMYNRRKLYEDLTASDRGVTAMAMFDVDFFKNYNDTYGHLAGDQCLSTISASFLSFAKTHPVTFYRYGGEEFVMLYRAEEGAVETVETVRKRIEQLQMEHVRSSFGVVTVSVGLAIVDGEISDERLLSKADQALYAAKANGRNCSVVYTQQINNILLSLHNGGES